MAHCEHREIYTTHDKVGLICTRDGFERRITCELVCTVCQEGGFPVEEEKPEETVEDEVTSEEPLDFGDHLSD